VIDPVQNQFVDVKVNELPKANNTNALHAAVRELQSARVGGHEETIELARLRQSSFYLALPEFDDGAIGTADVTTGVVTHHDLTSTDNVTFKVTETISAVERKFPNVAQRVFSRDDVFCLVPRGSRWIPMAPAGSVVVWAVTQSTIAKATAMLTPTFGNADVVDWNAGGTALEATGQTVRLANMDWYSNGGIPADVLVAAIQYGKVYVIQTVFCGTV
jgi:hypothetical protein